MVQTIKAQDSGLRAFVVLRAICIAGERVEPGASVSLSKVVGSELAAASKVAPEGSDAANAAKEAAHAAAQAAKKAGAKAAKAGKPAEGAAEGEADTSNHSEDPQ